MRPTDAASDPFHVDLDRFQGPLDLLLHLIRRQDIDIFDIPIARITEQFLAAIGRAERLELERAGAFIEMAAVLVRIKAQMLFPRPVDDSEDDPRAELVRRLLEHEHFHEAALRLGEAESRRTRLAARGHVEARVQPQLRDAPLEVTWDELWAAALGLGARSDVPDVVHRVSSRPVRIEEKIELIEAALARTRRVEFAALVAPWGTRMHAVVSLLACLELAKRSALRLRQALPYAPLWIYRPTQEAA
jgi:segregation and condensation protein A